jgi:ribonuclease HII
LILPPDFSFEAARTGVTCGIDEAGRGPLAGPVVAASVILPRALPPLLARHLNDSKLLSAARRVQLFDALEDCAQIGCGRAEVDEIDRLNIVQATFLAMRRALGDHRVDHALVDGNRPPPLPCPVICVIGGDRRSFSIAAASIIAKVSRDRLMAELAARYPGYGWERNAGYGTAEHKAALKHLGVTPQHRRSFAPVAALIALADRDAIDRRCRTESHSS